MNKLPSALFLLVLISTTFVGCASMPGLTKKTDPNTYPDWQAHQSQLHALRHWQVAGRIFIQTSDDGFSSNINWNNQADQYHIRFTAPMGQGTYDLNGSPEKVSMTLPDNSTSEAKDPESLMKKTLGVKLPVSGLSYWIRGLPDPENASRDILLDSNERLIKLEQAGWQISISRYRQHRDVYLPDKLTMQNKHVKIKMALKNWTLGEAVL